MLESEFKNSTFVLYFKRQIALKIPLLDFEKFLISNFLYQNSLIKNF